VHVGGEWFYDEFAGDGGVKSLGLDEAAPVPDTPAPPVVQVSPPTEEKKNILDLFKN
jgi:penicillin-binding protein 1A